MTRRGAPPRAAADAIRVSYFYDLPLPAPLAAPIQFLNTCRELACLGVPTTVYAGAIGAGGCLPFYGLAPHEKLAIVPLFSRLPGRADLIWRLPKILRTADANRTHFLISRGETGVALLPRLRRLGVPASARLVYEAHRLGFAHEAERESGRRWSPGDALPRRAEQARRQEREAVEGADGLVCLTPAVKDALETAFRVASPTLVLPSGVTLAAAPGALAGGLASRDIDVIYAGKLEARKGLDTLLAAMPHLPGRHLWVLGGAPDRVEEHRLLAARLGVGERVTFTGFIEPARVPEYLSRARVGVCPLPTGMSGVSDEFTSPLKLLELMAYGVPVVASDTAPVRAIAEHGRTALLVAPGDAQALAAGIDTVLSSPELAERLRAAALLRAAEFSWAVRARSLLDFLERLAPATPQHRLAEDRESAEP